MDILAAYSGDVVVTAPELFDDYVRSRWPRLVRTAVLLGADHHAAEDLVQTALTKCYRRWDRVLQARDPDAYVHRVLVNTLRAAHRRLWRLERPHAVVPDTPRANDQIAISDTVQAVWAALERLPRAQRDVVVLRYYADLSVADTAEALGISQGTVKSRCSRALAALAAESSLKE